MFSLIEMLGREVAPIRVVDVGAMAIGDEPPPYARIVRDGVTEVVGFEPVRAECDKLNAKARAGHRYLPYFIGDGRDGVFRECRFTQSSSLYKPNGRLRRRFPGLAQFGEVVRESPVSTRRLDDVPEIGGADYLKLDIQGAELDALRGATRLLAKAVFVETEVEFVPLYEGQPLFAEVDAFLRSQGFLLHTFTSMSGRPFLPLHPPNRPSDPFRQLVWGDAVYVKDFTRLGDLTASQLLRMAAIAHDLYASPDLAGLALQQHDAKTGRTVWKDYMTRLIGSVPEAPSLE